MCSLRLKLIASALLDLLKCIRPRWNKNIISLDIMLYVAAFGEVFNSFFRSIPIYSDYPMLELIYKKVC